MIFVYLSMFLVGLTGGIASGKSTVSSQLKELGCPVIDADVVARKGAMKVFLCACTFVCINIYSYKQKIKR